MSDTLVLIKPDAVARGLIGEIVTRIERRGFKILLMELQPPDRHKMHELYEKFTGAGWFDALLDFMVSGPVVAIMASRHRAVYCMRQLVGPGGEEPGSIRGDLATSQRRNVIHASDSIDDAVRELRICFPDHHTDNVS